MAAKVGLTGGIGSGKSTVGELFRSMGVEVIDADEIARQVTAPGTEGLKQIIARFGDRVVTDKQTLDRRKLGRIVFSDTSERKWLEALLHPVIRAQMDTLAERCDAIWCVLEIPLLVESGRHREMDRNIIVQCNAETRIERIMMSRGMERETVERIIASQASDAERQAVADHIIENNGSLDYLRTQVQRVADALNNEIFRQM